MVGTVKKSTETRSLTWFARNVRHVCEEGIPAPQHVFADAGLPDVDAQLEQLAVDARGAPERILSAHATDEISDLP
jgi:hypothetical protein